jgi:hypothetical protein
MATITSAMIPQRCRLAMLGILVILDTLWSLKQAVTLVPTISSTAAEDNMNTLAATMIGGIHSNYSSWLQSFSSPAGVTSASSNAAATAMMATSPIGTIHDRRDNSLQNDNGTSSSNIQIDILSIGSMHRRDHQMAQRDTFGSHNSVRNFIAMDESNDAAEPHCHANLTLDHVHRISQFCRYQNGGGGPRNKNSNNQDDDDDLVWRMRKNFARFEWLQKKSNAPGWMCAQKRLPGGLATVLKSYFHDKQQQQQQQQQEQERHDHYSRLSHCHG